jgi:hypothetical protein
LAPIEASHHYQVALDMAIALDRPVAERANLLVRLGDAQHRSGDAAALSTLEQGAELARQRGRGTLSSGRRSPVTAVSCVASITIYWSPPTSDGGSAITGYNVYESTTSGGESTTPCNSSPLPSSTGKFTVTGLKSGKKYYFEVKAINAVGTGAASKQAATTPAATSSILRVGHDTPRLGVLSLTRYWATRTGFVVAWGRHP